jgi:predicted  nucleic acid-binding Zn-ribbon protein
MSTVTKDASILNLAVKKQTEVIRHVFSEEEINDMNGRITSNLRKSYDLEAELNEIKEEFKGKMKPLEKDNKSLLKQTKDGFVDRDQDVYLIPDYDNRIMELYNEDGIKVGDRKMLMAEMQGHLDLK